MEHNYSRTLSNDRATDWFRVVRGSNFQDQIQSNAWTTWDWRRNGAAGNALARDKPDWSSWVAAQRRGTSDRKWFCTSGKWVQRSISILRSSQRCNRCFAATHPGPVVPERPHTSFRYDPPISPKPWIILLVQGGPRKVSHYQIIKKIYWLIKACQLDHIWSSD